MIFFAKCIVLAGGGLLALFSFMPAVKTVDYPKDYRRWVHVKSGLVGPENPALKRYEGIHHIYANQKGMQGYRTGNFPDGAVIVFDLLEVQVKNGLTAEGPRKFIDVMQKDSKRFKETGGWGFEEFRGDSRTERALDAKGAAQCFACHASQKEKDFVFSSFRE